MPQPVQTRNRCGLGGSGTPQIRSQRRGHGFKSRHLHQAPQRVLVRSCLLESGLGRRESNLCSYLALSVTPISGITSAKQESSSLSQCA